MERVFTRDEAIAELADRGFTFDPDYAVWRGPNGEVGRLGYTPVRLRQDLSAAQEGYRWFLHAPSVLVANCRTHPPYLQQCPHAGPETPILPKGA